MYSKIIFKDMEMIMQIYISFLNDNRKNICLEMTIEKYIFCVVIILNVCMINESIVFNILIVRNVLWIVKENIYV